MGIKRILQAIIKELEETFLTISEQQLADLKKEILSADKIFVTGAGRSLMMIRGLAMRLMHMGFQAYVVGETVTPAIGRGDLLIIASGSGATQTLTVIAEKCKKIGAALALITTMPDSPIGNMADYVVEVPAATTKSERNTKISMQPGANTFEQSVLLIGDAIVIDMVSNNSLSDNNKVLMDRHANLE